MHRILICLCTSALVAGLASPALAQEVNCKDLPNVVIGAGGSASKPLLKAVGTALRNLASDPVTLVYQAPGACFGITPFIDGSKITGTANYWESDGAEKTCKLPITGLTPDFGMLGTKATLCQGVTALPATVGEFGGPVTSWSLIVPSASTEQSISREALYFVYGFGPEASEAAPWTVKSELKGRNATSAALIAIALAAGIPAEKMAANVGTDEKTNQQMITSVAGSSNVNAALGFVSTEVADLNRTSVRTLAYQHTDQACGYTPDSTATAFDKRNVRDGHYYLWSAYNFYAPVDGSGDITNPLTRRVIGYFTGDEPLPDDLPLLDITIDNGNIPECAMEVWRDADIGPLYSYQPAKPCKGYFEKRATGTTDAAPCTSDAECIDPSAPVCRFGFCEVK